MKKAVLCLLLCLLLFPFRGTAEASDPTGFDLRKLAEDTVFLANADDPSVSILGLERNADVKRYPASTTKIMTCILALENSEPDELVTVSKKACNLSDRNSKMGLKAGETYTMIDLLYGLMLPSGNDAAIAIAEHIGGSIGGFADLMNAKAQDLGMTHSHFMNPHGLHHSDHYSTARDLAVLTAYALENETFAEIVSTTEYTARSTDGRKVPLRSSNRLLRDVTAQSYTPYSCLYPYAIGVKTGDTHLAGKCLVAAARKGGVTYIAVLLHGESAPEDVRGREKDLYSAQRFYDAIDLFEYAFANDMVVIDAESLRDRCLPDTIAVIPDPPDRFISEALYSIEWDEGEMLTVPRWQAGILNRDPLPEDLLTYEIESFSVPIGEIAGTASITVDGNAVFSGSLIAEDYTYPPTPAPTQEPVYIITDETAEPTDAPVTVPPTGAVLTLPPSPVPSERASDAPATEWIPVPSSAPSASEKASSGSCWNFFRCNPSD